MDDITKVLGSRIKEERIKKGFTIEKLAEIMELTPSFLGLIERGKRCLSVENLYKISEIFGITIDSLVKGNLYAEDNVTRFEELKVLMNEMDDTRFGFVIDMVRLMNVRLK